MRSFEYAAPESISAAVALLAEASGVARPLAGGTDLITQLKEGRRQADLVVDLKRIPDLNVLESNGAGGLRIGAAVSCARLQADTVIQQLYPALAHVCGIIGSYQIQNRATLGGNLCNASPSADSVPALIVHDAVAVIAGPSGRRTVPVEEFCTAPGRTVLQRGEILVEIQVPAPPARFGAVYQRFIPRNEMDIAVVGVGSSLRLGAGGEVESARIALAAVAPVPLRVQAAEAVLVGKKPSPELFSQAGKVAAEACSPISDVRGSADYRRHLVSVLTGRTLAGALQLSTGGK